MGYQRPLELGADISMTSATKFIGGELTHGRMNAWAGDA